MNKIVLTTMILSASAAGIYTYQSLQKTHQSTAHQAFILGDSVPETQVLETLKGKKIAIFSATLNPPTIAHEMLIDHLLNMKTPSGNNRFDYIYIHVTEDSPTGHYKANTAPYEMRHDMTHRAFKGKKRIILSEMLPLQTVKQLMRIQNIDVSYILGADSMDWMEKCHEKGDAKFFTGHTEPKAKVMNEKTKEMFDFTGRSVFELKATKILIVERGNQQIPESFLNVPTEIVTVDSSAHLSNTANIADQKNVVSSTRIREFVQAGKIDAAREMVAKDLQPSFQDFLSLYR